MALKRLTPLPERVRIIREILEEYEEQELNGVKYTQVPLTALVEHGLPISAMNPAYWSGTSPGIKAAVKLDLTTFFSKKGEFIRFMQMSANDKIIWNERLEKNRPAVVRAIVDDEVYDIPDTDNFEEE